MRWVRFIAVALFVVVAACGGGDKTTSSATGSATSDQSLSAGPSGSDGTDSVAAGQSGGGGDTSQAQGADPGAGGGAPGDSSGAPVPGLKPFAGTYSMHTTGFVNAAGNAQNVDTTDQLLVEDLSDTDQRGTGGGPQGQQIQVLRYSNDKIELLSLEFRGPLNKIFNGPVLLAPAPASVGQTWEWSMQSADTDPTKKTTLTQSSRVDRTETLVVGGQTIEVIVIETDLTLKSSPADVNATGHLTTWFSPVYKVAAKIHSTLSGTYAAFQFTSDTTSELLDLRPS